MARQHVILTTHTALHLRTCLEGLARQSLPADSVTLSCDVVSPEIAEVVRAFSDGPGREVLLVEREHTGKARCAQVRNNGVRALLAGGRTGDGDRLIFLDADTAPGREAVERHAALGGERGLVSTFRVNLTSEQTARFDLDALATGREPVALLDEQRRELAQRQRRYRRQLLIRRLGLGKAHKPRLIGGHFSVPLAGYVAVNGTDEAYEGYGQEDDDLSRRLHRAGFPTVVAVDAIVVYHLWHPSRAPAAWDTAPGVARFRQQTPVRTELGLDRPAAQGPVRVRWARGGAFSEVDAGAGRA